MPSSHSLHLFWVILVSCLLHCQQIYKLPRFRCQINLQKNPTMSFTMENYWTHQNSVCLCMVDLCQYAHLNIKVSLNYTRFLQELSVLGKVSKTLRFWTLFIAIQWYIWHGKISNSKNLKKKMGFEELQLSPWCPDCWMVSFWH